ncbi:SusC/RagA family TonB-linked outer membrane protein [Mucilaginibacter puniceus]
MKLKTQAMPRAGLFLSKNLLVPTLVCPILIFAITATAANKPTSYNLFKKGISITNIKPVAEIITGTVIDNNGQPLPGVTIKIKDATTGTTSDVNGKYTISVPDATAVLSFSMIGFETQEITVGTSRTINVTLIESVSSLNEVIVVGYGTQRRETLTGSIAKVQGEDLTKNQSVNVATSLAGRLPGLIVNQRNGVPGSENLDIVIRGASTFGNNNPLIVVDGVPRGTGILSTLNPQDIESITVLKDGSAAIYGARAANGVVLVTTKPGSKSKTVYNFSYVYGITNPTKVPDMMDAALFAEVFNETQYYLQGRPATGFNPFFTDAAIQKYRDGSDPILYPNTDWANLSLNKNTPQQRLNFQASGGSDKVRYLLSFGSSSQGSNYRNQPYKYKQYNARVRIDADLSQYLTVGANIAGVFRERSESNGTDFVTILQANPTLPAIYPNGLLAGGRFDNSPLLSDRRGYNRWNDDPITTSFTASFKVPHVQGLVLDASYNYDFRNQFQKNFSQPHYWHVYNVQTQQYDRTEANTPISLTDRYDRWITTLANFRISYKTTIAKNHNIAAMVGTEQQTNSNTYASAYRRNFLSAVLPQINAGSTRPEDLNNSGNASAGSYNSFFGRFNYNYQSKYLLEATFRYEGSPIFPQNKRYGFFPNVSAGWIISEENFMRDVKFVNNLKLRATYGELGNDQVAAFQYLQAFQLGNNYVFGGTTVPGVYSSTLPNPNITWEVSKKLDFGLSATLFNRMLDVDITVWNQKRSNLLLRPNLSVSGVFGFPAIPDQNIGKVNSSGFEVELTHRNKVGDLSYSISGNVGYAKSKIVFMDEVPPAYDYQRNTGVPLGSGLYYKSDGIFNTQAELDSYPHGTGAQVGDIKVLDLNNDGKIDGNDRYRTNQSPTPLYLFGLNTNFQYKGFDLTVFFQGQAQAYTYDGTLDEFGLTDLDNATVYRATNRWTVNNQEGATMPRANNWQPGTTDFFLYDATFVRLKNVELGYTFRGDLIKKIGVSNLRAFVNGTNLLTWSKEISWRDPELSGGFTTYPPLKILSFGVNLQF